MTGARGGRALTAFSAVLAGVSGAVPMACDGEVRFEEPGSTTDAGLDVAPARDASSDAALGPEVSPVSRACQDDSACAVSQARCIPTQGVCVGCLDDGDCALGYGPRRQCDTKGHVCVECTEASHCGPGRYCDPGTSRCVEWCFDDSRACFAPGFTCIEKDRRCAECSRNDNCKGGVEAYCNTIIGRCVECFSSAQCTSAKRLLCLRYTGRCVECMNDLGCTPPARCDARTGACVQ